MKIQFPPAALFKTKKETNSDHIFCLVRKKWLVLSPEEWVRQNLIWVLNVQYHYPLSLMRLEGGLSTTKGIGRTDLEIYKQDGALFLLAECKAPRIKINQKSIDQIALYNLKKKSPYLLLSNGTYNYLFVLQEGKTYKQTMELPFYNNQKA